MGDRTLEAKLTSRLLAVVAPALVALGVASVALTWWALDSADSDVARARAGTALAAMHSELAEPDPFPKAAREVLHAVNEIGGSLVVVDLAAGTTYASRYPVPPSLVGTRAGDCAKDVDAAGERWRACAAADDRVAIVAAIDVTPHAKVVRKVAEGVTLGIVLTLLAAALAARTALRGALASVRALVDWSERVVSTDDPPPAPPAADTREIARLAGAFDAVVRGLVDAIARARATNENIAHELRTPLTTMQVELETLALRASCPLDAESAARVAHLREDVARLARVVDAILVLAAPPERARGDDCVVNLADVARELAPAGTTVDAPDEALVMAEPRLVELALTNLLENARKHTGREAIAIRIAHAGGMARVAVIDDGPGLDDDARARMFDRYWRASGDGGGTGLGLALVRAVARRHGGEADARPSATGPGLEVGITFARVVGWHDGA